MLGALFLVGQELALEGGVFFWRAAAPPRARERAVGDDEFALVASGSAGGCKYVINRPSTSCTPLAPSPSSGSTSSSDAMGAYESSERANQRSGVRSEVSGVSITPG